VPGEDSPAERAARIGRAASVQTADGLPGPPRRRPRWRVPVIVAAVAVLVFGGIAGAYAFTQSYYFVGRDGSDVAIFRGVNAQFGPLKFFNVYKNTDLALGDLNPAVRSQVSDGIDARNERDAEQIVANLHQQVLPPCPTATPTQSITPTRSPSTSRTPSPTRATAKTVKPASTTRTSTHPATTPASSASTIATPLSPSYIPQVTCR
jgi:PPM family protein phosphatase